LHIWYMRCLLDLSVIIQRIFCMFHQHQLLNLDRMGMMVFGMIFCYHSIFRIDYIFGIYRWTKLFHYCFYHNHHRRIRFLCCRLILFRNHHIEYICLLMHHIFVCRYIEFWPHISHSDIHLTCWRMVCQKGMGSNVHLSRELHLKHRLLDSNHSVLNWFLPHRTISTSATVPEVSFSNTSWIWNTFTLISSSRWRSGLSYTCLARSIS